MTTTLRIEHGITDFETWQQAFDRDPVGRERMGVLRYRISRPVDDPKYVMIDLDFAGRAEAEAFLEALRNVWSRADLSPGLSRASAATPTTRIIEEVAALTYR